MVNAKLSVVSGTTISSSIFSDGILAEVPNEPLVKQVLDTTTGLRKTNPAQYQVVMDSLRTAMRRYSEELSDEQVLLPKGSVAWPYLLSMLSDDPHDLEYAERVANALK